MSIKNVKAFFEKVEGDKALQDKLKALESKIESAAAAELVKIAAGCGIRFTIADLAAARKKTDRALSKDEIKPVSPPICADAGHVMCMNEFNERCYPVVHPFI
jgi:predicted ribosomally synthesized peptide with nif11-like leader